MGATKLRASTQLLADDANFTTLSQGGSAVLTTASDLSAALTGKHVIQLVASIDLTNKSGATFTVGGDLADIPINTNVTPTVAANGSTNGLVSLLESSFGMAIVAHQYNTNNSGLHIDDAASYRVDIYNTDGSRLMDGQDEVWGVFTASARAAGNILTLRLFKGEWKGDGSQAEYTAAALDFFMAYPVLTDLSAMSRTAFRSDTVNLSKQAAGILGSSIDTAELANGAVTAPKAALGAALGAGVDDVIDVQVDGATVEVNGDNQLGIPAGGVGTTELGDSAVTGAKTSFVNAQYTGADLTGASDDTLTLAGTPVVATLFVFAGGALQRRGAGNDYTIAANVITFLSIPDVADNIEVYYMT